MPRRPAPVEEYEMQSHSLRHVDNAVLLRDLHAIAATDRATTAKLLAHIAEVDLRKLYAEKGYSAMFYYCIRELHFSEDMAAKRIRAARVARRFPAVYDAIADGRLHLTAICQLSKPLRFLSGDDAAHLLTAAEHKTKEEIEIMLAERFPQPDLATRVRALDPSESVLQLQVPEPVDVPDSSSEATEPTEDRSTPPTAVVTQSLAAPPAPSTPPDRTRPLSPGRFALQLTISSETLGKLRHSQDLLGHVVEHDDLATVLDRALDALIEKLERRRYGATDRPRAARPSQSIRHIPSSVRRAVRARDGLQCTFVSDDGTRCEERRSLEFDHVIPVANGGEATVANLRLRCRTHNQLAAEQAYGAAFMEDKREKAQRARALKPASRSLH